MSSSGTADGAPIAPLVVACLRCGDQRPSVDPLTGHVETDLKGLVLAPSDAAALEHALRIAEARSGRVLAVAAGTSAVEGALGEVRALGVQVVRLEWPPAGRAAPEPAGGPAYLDELAGDEGELAREVANAILRVGRPAVVLCGDRSADRGTGAFPAFLAHELRAAQALGLLGLSVDGEAILGERRLEGGRREILRVPSPSVCSVEAAGTRLRRASLPAVLEAAGARIEVSHPAAPATRDRPVRVVAARAFVPRTRVIAPPSGTARERLVALTGALADRRPPTVVGPLDSAEAADVLLGYLDRNGYLDHGGDLDHGDPVRPS